MNPINLNKINTFCQQNKNKIIKFLSDIIKIKSYSNNEKNLVDFIIKYIQTINVKGIRIKKIKNNILIFVGKKDSSVNLLFDAHLDTVPAENYKDWRYPPFSGKVSNDRIYGRGSCDDKSSVVSLVFTSIFLAKNNYNNKQIVFSLSSNEENSSGKGIEEVLKYVEPKYCIICEPSNLNIAYGHKGKWSIKLKFYGKSAHSSLPHLGKNAIYSVYPVIKNIIESENKNFIKSYLGKPTYTITLIESKTNSLNSIPHECSVYIDYRSVLGETEESIKNFLLKNVKENNYDFIPQHRFFKAWLLNKNHQLLKIAKQTYKICFNKDIKPLLWQFCTNGSITMADYNIPTIGFGPGNPFLAHQDNEYVKIKDIFEAIKFYSMLSYQNI
ncbi:MAG: M20/M25/M40 family metallo-hydrolase [Endomicrobiia bacterium]